MITPHERKQSVSIIKRVAYCLKHYLQNKASNNIIIALSLISDVFADQVHFIQRVRNSHTLQPLLIHLLSNVNLYHSNQGQSGELSQMPLLLAISGEQLHRPMIFSLSVNVKNM